MLGMVIVNPPYMLNKKLEEVVPLLWDILSPDKQGTAKVEWLVPE